MGQSERLEEVKDIEQDKVIEFPREIDLPSDEILTNGVKIGFFQRLSMWVRQTFGSCDCLVVEPTPLITYRGSSTKHILHVCKSCGKTHLIRVNRSITTDNNAMMHEFKYR